MRGRNRERTTEDKIQSDLRGDIRGADIRATGHGTDAHPVDDVFTDHDPNNVFYVDIRPESNVRPSDFPCWVDWQVSNPHGTSYDRHWVVVDRDSWKRNSFSRQQHKADE